MSTSQTHAWLPSPYHAWALALLGVITRWLLYERRTFDEDAAADAALDGVTYAAGRQPATEDDFRRLAMQRARSALIDQYHREERNRRAGPPRGPSRAASPVWDLSGQLSDHQARLVLLSEGLTGDPDMLTYHEIGTAIHGLYGSRILEILEQQRESCLDTAAARAAKASPLRERIAALAGWQHDAGQKLRPLAEVVWYEHAGLQDRQGTLGNFAGLNWRPEAILSKTQADRWKDLLPLWVQSLGLPWNTGDALACLRLLREWEVPFWESSTVTSLPVRLGRAALDQPTLDAAGVFRKLRQMGLLVVAGGDALRAWLSAPLTAAGERFVRRRRAERFAALALARAEDPAPWQPFRWYQPPVPPDCRGRPVAELTVGVAAEQSERQAARALAVWLGAELLPPAPLQQARANARLLGLDLVFTISRAGNTEPAETHAPRGFCYHVEMIEVEGGEQLWCSPAELEHCSCQESSAAHYHRAYEACRRARAAWRDLCLEAGLVPDDSFEEESMPGLGLSTVLSGRLLSALARRGAAAPPLMAGQRELLAERTARLLIDRDALADHTSQLLGVYRPPPAGVGRRFPHHEILPGEQVERLLDGGPVALKELGDDALVELLLNPVALYDLHDLIDEALPSAWCEPLHALLRS